MNDRFTLWVWGTKNSGEVLFHGNPNPECLKFHLGNVSNLIHGDRMLYGYTKWELVKFFKPSGWNKVNAKYPELKVYPKKITISMKDFKR